MDCVRRLAALCACAALAGACAVCAADEIELTDGKRYEGKVVEQTDAAVTFQIVLPGGGNIVAKFPAHQVRSVKKAGETAPAPKTGGDTPEPEPKPTTGPPTEADVIKAIDEAGKTAPDWWDKVEMNYPKTLDLAGTKASRSPQENLEVYVRAVVYADPGKWKETVKLLAYAVTVRKDDKDRMAQAMGLLANAYYSYLRDWARAAFWWRAAFAAGYKPYVSDMAALAACYARLGSKAMAVALLKKYNLDTRASDASIVGVWALVGEVATAKAVADRNAAGGGAELQYLRAGHALRSAGEYAAAAECYEKATKVTGGNARTKERAQLGLDAAKPLAAVNLAGVPDGTYKGASKGFRDLVEVEVTVKDKRITSAKVTKHREDAWFYNRASGHILPGIVESQGLKDVDTVSGATFTSEAILNAVAKALSSAVK